MTKTTIILISAILLLSSAVQNDFLAEQKKYERVRTAIKDSHHVIEKRLKENNLSVNNFNLVFVAYKESKLLDVYAKTKQEEVYRKLHTYQICARSGQPGPKRKQGDGQIPEGFYHIDRFNPKSNFYLSLGLNYPNLSDKRKSKYDNLGGDIFIHGSCVTIGCLPMTDNYIKEIYLLAVHAKNNGQSRIPVYIFPFKMTDENFSSYKAKYRENKELISFWYNLKIGYDRFFEVQKELNVKVMKNGDYSYQN